MGASLISRLKQVFADIPVSDAGVTFTGREATHSLTVGRNGVLIFRGQLTIPRLQGTSVPEIHAEVSELDIDVRNRSLAVTGLFSVGVSREGFGTPPDGDAASASIVRCRFRAHLPASLFLPNRGFLPSLRLEVFPGERTLLSPAEGAGMDYRPVSELTYEARFRLVFRSDAVIPSTGACRTELDAPQLIVKKALLRVDEVVDTNSTEILVDRSLQLDVPGVRVIDVNAAVTETHLTLLDGRVIARARVFQQIYFVSDNGVIRYQHDVFDIEQPIEVASSTGMNARATVTLRGVDAELGGDGSALRERVCLRFAVRVIRPVEMEVVSGVDWEGGLPGDAPHVIRDRIKVDHVVGMGIARRLVEDEIHLPMAASRISRVLTIPGPVALEVIDGRVLVDGVIQRHLFFHDQTGVEHMQETEVPYHCFVNLPQVQSGMRAAADVKVGGVDYDLAEGGRVLRFRSLISAPIRVVDSDVVDVVTAVLGDGIVIEEKQLTAERLVGQANIQDMVEKRARLVTPSLRIVKIVSSVKDLVWEVIPDEVIVQGRLHQHVFFIDRHKVQRHQTEEIRFSRLVRVSGALSRMQADVEVNIRHTSHDLMQDAVTFSERVVLDIGVRVVEDVQLSVVTGISHAPGGAGRVAHSS